VTSPLIANHRDEVGRREALAGAALDAQEDIGDKTDTIAVLLS
jgi:hypothetical protein